MTESAQDSKPKKQRFLTKSVQFGTKSMTLYSIDGTTWSSRKDELQIILERHEAERQKLLQNMGEARAEDQAEAKEAPVAAVEVDEDAPMIVTDDVDLADDEEDDTPKRKVAAKAAPVAKAAAKSKKKPSRRDRVEVLTPKPRALDKKRGKTPAKSKKRAA